MLKIIYLIIIFIFPILAKAQPPDTVWTHLYADGRESYGLCVRQTEDYGYILVGSNKQYSQIYSDVFLVKTDSLLSKINFIDKIALLKSAV